MNPSQIGQAGEYLTLFDITTQNYKCFNVNESLCFDLGMTDKDNEMYRVQVKTTNRLRTKSAYQFRLAKSVKTIVQNGEGKPSSLRHHEKEYNVTDFEIIALVILPKKRVFYVPFHAIHGQKYLNLRGDEALSLKSCLESIKQAEEK
jgi:hypothetical protein